MNAMAQVISLDFRAIADSFLPAGKLNRFTKGSK